MVYFPKIFLKIAPVLSLLLLFTVQCSQDPDTPLVLDIEYEETLLLGTDDSEAPDHKIFRSVTHVEVDDQGWMYVVNSGESSIRVFDDNGDFQSSFGSQGSGPGEFQAISSLLIDSHNRLLIVDSNQARITAYSLDGDFLSTWQLPSITRVHQIAELSNNKFALVGQHNDKMIHITDDEFSTIEASFMPVQDLLTSNEREERVLLQFFPGSIAVLPDLSIAYAPALYGGELFVYSATQEGIWNLTRTIEGQSFHIQPASFTAFDQADRVDMPITFPEEGRYAAQFHSFSQGIFSNDDLLVHYSFQESNEGELELRSEHFTMDGERIGTAFIDKMERLSVSILNLDDQANLYLSDSRDFPKLRRLKVID